MNRCFKPRETSFPALFYARSERRPYHHPLSTYTPGPRPPGRQTGPSGAAEHVQHGHILIEVVSQRTV